MALSKNPFLEAFYHADFLGQAIFLALFLLSIISWIVISYHSWITYNAKRHSNAFAKAFAQQQATPLHVATTTPLSLSPFQALYLELKRHAIALLAKNRHFSVSLPLGGDAPSEQSHALSSSDIAALEGKLATAIAAERKKLEAHLYLLSMIVSLAPFLGLLGTVWGILTTFSELNGSAAAAHHMALHGLSLALATTVIGLIDAIPALVGYNIIKNQLRRFETEMTSFAMNILSAVELQYRAVDLGK